MKKGIKVFFFFLIFLFIDVLTKYLVQKYIPKMSIAHPFFPYGGIGILNFGKIKISINFVENFGAAWGLFSKYPKILFFIRISVIFCLATYLIFSSLKLKQMVPYFFIITGALGNVLDYFFYGFVVDMVYIQIGRYSNPVFNLADMMIFIGIIALLFESFILFFKRKKGM